MATYLQRFGHTSLIASLPGSKLAPSVYVKQDQTCPSGSTKIVRRQSFFAISDRLCIGVGSDNDVAPGSTKALKSLLKEGVRSLHLLSPLPCQNVRPKQILRFRN